MIVVFVLFFVAKFFVVRWLRCFFCDVLCCVLCDRVCVCVCVCVCIVCGLGGSWGAAGVGNSPWVSMGCSVKHSVTFLMGGRRVSQRANFGPTCGPTCGPMCGPACEPTGGKSKVLGLRKVERFAGVVGGEGGVAPCGPMCGPPAPHFYRP